MAASPVVVSAVHRSRQGPDAATIRSRRRSRRPTASSRSTSSSSPRCPMRAAEPARMNLLLDEPGTQPPLRQHDERHALHRQLRRQDREAVSRLNDPKWGNPVQSGGSERGFQSFAFHPQFAQAGSAGLRQVLHVRRHHEHDADARLRAARQRPTRTTRSCSSGPPRIRRPRRTTAALRASCSASRIRSPTTTAG